MNEYQFPFLFISDIWEIYLVLIWLSLYVCGQAYDLQNFLLEFLLTRFNLICPRIYYNMLLYLLVVVLTYMIYVSVIFHLSHSIVALHKVFISSVSFILSYNLTFVVIIEELCVQCYVPHHLILPINTTSQRIGRVIHSLSLFSKYNLNSLFNLSLITTLYRILDFSFKRVDFLLLFRCIDIDGTLI